MTFELQEKSEPSGKTAKRAILLGGTGLRPRMISMEAEVRLLSVFIMIVLGGPLVLSFFWAPVPDSHTFCMFKRTLGLPDAGCGLTRSFCSISHGRFVEALEFNPLGPLFYAGFAIFAAVSVYTLLTARDVIFRLFRRYVGLMTGVLFGLVVGLMAGRIIGAFWFQDVAAMMATGSLFK
ncbi:MAG: DUF2752 domain-containing protein [Planctomycetes bacterium]|nr:DUF2752 domain-containing protein [Planctomycetota bacterium]